MKVVRPFLAASLALFLIAAVWVWWSRPHKTDMAAYAPADALVYLESNDVLNIAESLINTDAWKALRPFMTKTGGEWRGRWLRHLTAWSGIGPTQTVILTRAQMAIVVLDLGAREQDETITIKPEAAILIETHTTERRIRSTVEQALRRFAEMAYRQPTFKKSDRDRVEIFVWTAPAGDRQIVATIDGSLVIIGNSERAVKTCLEVHQGQRPNLRSDPEMQQMRLQLAADQAMAFGFVSSANAARLLSLGGPILFGRAPGNPQLEGIIASSPAKVFGGVGWSSQKHKGGIEDRYLVSLRPTIVARLQPFFQATSAKGQALEFLPEDVHSLTIYRFHDPEATWQAFASAVSAQVDALSSVVFTSLLNSALVPYGIEEPEKFLSVVGPELITARLKRDAERALLIAQVRNESTLREMFRKSMGGRLNSDRLGQNELIEFPGKRSALSFLNGYLLIGSAQDVRHCVQAAQNRNATKADPFERLVHFVPFANSAGVVTYTDDSERVRNFILAISQAQGAASLVAEPTQLKSTIDGLPYCATETILSEHGLERRTRSSFGQFSTLVPLLFPQG